MIEICTGSYQDCLAAYKGGAKRVELNSALSVGGLTPSLSTLIRVKNETDLKVICMVRPRAAGFCYDKDDKNIMMDDARLFLEHGADGIAFGFLNEDGSIQMEYTKEMVDLIHSYHKEAVFHRAFDVTPDPFQAMEILIELGVDRLLTSGQKAKAMEGIELIKSLQEKYGQQIEILAGSGMNASNAKEMMDYTGISQVHSSCKAYKEDGTTQSKYVSYSYIDNSNQYDIVSKDLVKKLMDATK
ncbi:MAG: copper homeostasis protein CutC [Bacillota bacterium]|nr:copper homeostasis protein CutC [Bacillota bacterium]